MESRLLLPRLHSCTNLRQINQVHSFLLTSVAPHGFLGVLVLKLVDLCFLDYARQVFDEIPKPSVFVSNRLLSKLSRLGRHKEVISCFVSIHRNSCPIDSLSFPPVLKACGSLSEPCVGIQIHALIVELGFESNVIVQTGLVDLYGKSKALESAERVFGEILMKDLVSFNALISVYSKNGRIRDARQVFDEMCERDVVTWNSMISGYLNNGELMKGIELFEQMCMDMLEPNVVTLVAAMSISGKLGDLERGRRIKEYIDARGFRMNVILSTAVMKMYIRCGSTNEAREVFDGMGEKDAVAWTTMISGYTQNGQFDEAIMLFDHMRGNILKPNEGTLVSVLTACARSGSAEAGDQLGVYIENEDLTSNVLIGSALVDMYVKTGKLGKAEEVFDKMVDRDIVTWNAMIGGLAMHGLIDTVIVRFGQLRDLKIEPNEVTFIGILTACVHAGLVEMGCRIYDFMQENFNISPQMEHCACIVDLFCRAGLVMDAYMFTTKMDLEPNVVIWGTLLSACRIHNNVELAECASEKLMVLEPENSGNYVLLSNIYADVGRWCDVLRLRNLMKVKQLQKNPAYSWIEMDGIVHKFLIDDRSHPQSNEIYSIVEGLGRAIEEREADVF